MSDLFGNHIVCFLTRRLIFCREARIMIDYVYFNVVMRLCGLIASQKSSSLVTISHKQN